MFKNAHTFPLPALFVFALLTLFISGLSFAQEPAKTDLSDAPGLVPNYGYTMSFVRPPGIAPNEAVLRITQPVAVNGCLSVNTPAAYAKIMGPTVKVVVSAPVIKADKTPQYGNAACKKHAPAVVSDVTLNRDQLIAGRVDKIELSGPGGSDSYDLYVDQDKLYLYTKIRDPERGSVLRLDYFDDKYFFKPSISQSRHAPLTHWFYPDNIVVLSVPDATPDQNVAGHVQAIAARQGFIRLGVFLKGFEPPVPDKNTLYFVDQIGRTAKSLSHDRDTHFGTVTAAELFQGPNGPYQKPEELEIIARLPGLHE